MQTTGVVIIAANAAHDSDLGVVAPHGHKSLIPLKGKTVLSRMVDNFRASSGISRIVLVGDRLVREEAPNVDVSIEAGETESETIINGVRAMEDMDRCLLLTADMPLISSQAVDDLLENASDADIVYPVVERDTMSEAYPERQANYMRTKEGYVTGSSIIMFRPTSVLSKEKLVTALLEARRNPTALVGLVGAGFALKLAFSTPSINDLEKQLSNSIGLQCRVYATNYPDLLFSLDSVQDLRLAEKIVGED